MATGTWQSIVDLLDPYTLTVQQQALPPNDRGDVLLWDTFMPRENVPSVELNYVTTVDYRPAADRREWNTRGRLVPSAMPTRRRVSIVPIEARDRLDEFEMQRVGESGGANAQIIKDMAMVTIPKRIDKLVDAVYRRLELDAFKAWTEGKIVQRNPENASITYEASFGFDSARLNTAATAWDDPGVNAYSLLLAWIEDAEDLVGPIKGAMLRRVTMQAILADAPNLPNSVIMTMTQIEERISQDKGSEFKFYVNENSIDVFDDGGTAKTRTKVWPAETIAAIPTDGKIGTTAFAPVLRAMEIASGRSDGAPGMDVRGVTTYHEVGNGGRELQLEAQLNALPIPDEQRVYVTDVGV